MTARILLRSSAVTTESFKASSIGVGSTASGTKLSCISESAIPWELVIPVLWERW